VIDIEDSLPGDRLGGKVDSCEAAKLLLSQGFGIGLVNADLLETSEPDPLELTISLLVLGYETVEERPVLLGSLVEHSGVNGSSEQVVCSSNGVNVTSQVHVELVHRNNLRVATASSTTLDTESRTLRRLPDVCKGNLA